MGGESVQRGLERQEPASVRGRRRGREPASRTEPVAAASSGPGQPNRNDVTESSSD